MFEIRATDILVIGGGGAGMRAAIAAAESGKKVVLLSKGPLARTGITPVAGEGVEGAVNAGDTPEFHYRDTVAAGRGLADENLVYALAQESVARIRDLESYGAKFKKNRMDPMLRHCGRDRATRATYSSSAVATAWPQRCSVSWRNFPA